MAVFFSAVGNFNSQAQAATGIIYTVLFGAVELTLVNLCCADATHLISMLNK